MFHKLASAVTLFLVIVPCNALCAWSEGGHHLIAVLALRQLPREAQIELFRILKAHPRYDEDFKPPGVWHEAKTEEQWLIGRAGYWPDIARSQKEFNRPNWHYQLGATLVVGDRAKVNVPTTPGELPRDANLETEDLHIAQALELCSKILADKSEPDADRAIAICWIAHLVADAHQPCHAGSLYAESLYPEGDRGANSIKTKQGKNMHALWDGLLGPRYNTGDVMRRVAEIEGNSSLQIAAESAVSRPGGKECETWLWESRELATRYVYAQPVFEPISVAVRSASSELPEIDLPEIYLKDAGTIARTRAAEAGKRLANVLGDAVQ